MILLVISLFILSISGQKQPHNATKVKFQVIRAHAGNIAQLEALRNIHLDTQHEIDFWLTPKRVGHRADIMVDDEQMMWMRDLLAAKNITYDVIIDDVEKLIVAREHGKSTRLSHLLLSRRLRNEGGNRARFNFGEYQSYQTILDWLKDIESKYPDRAQVFTIGQTSEGRPINGLKIGRDIRRTDKRVFWIDGGIHAREWAAVHTVLYFIERLIADYEDDPLVRSAVDNLNFYLVPVANPDGYEYSRSDVSPMIRLWRKNRAGVFCKKDRWYRDRCCGGVDLNRNFDWYFGEVGSSRDKCSEIYQGAAAFSERESAAIRDKIYSPEMEGKVDGFVSLHTYSQMWIHPFSHQRKTVPEDIADIERVGRAAVSALENTYGTKYKFGTGSDILYPSSGGSDDWAKGKVGAKYVYLLELRPGEEVWDGFILDQRQLLPTAKETWNGIKVVIKAVNDRAFSMSSAPKPAPVPAPVSITSFPSTTTLAPTTTTTTVTHLDAFYKFGKRRFKFVSIRTFLPTTTTPLPATSRFSLQPVTVPAFAPTVRFESDFDDGDVVDNDNGDEVIVVEGARRISATFNGGGAARPMAGRLGSRSRPSTTSTTSTTTTTQQILQRTGNARNGVSATRPRCADRSAWCAAWLAANRNVCQISSIYMRQDCARTCRFC